MNKHTLSAVGLSLGVCLLAIGGCALPEAPPFTAENIRAIQSRQIDAAAGHRPIIMPHLPGPRAEVPRVPTTVPANMAATRPNLTEFYTERRVPVTLQQAVHAAVESNSDVRAASYDTAVNEARVIEADSRFDPTAFFSLQYQRQASNNQFTSDPLSPRTFQTWQMQTGVRQILTTGTQVELKYQTSRNDLQDSFFTNPYWQNELSLQITQPLLADFGSEVNRARIAIAMNDQRISRLDFQIKLEDTVQKVEQAYWQLVQAIQDVVIQEDLLDRTRNAASILQVRVKGDVSQVPLWQVYAAVRQRESNLVRARARVREASYILKQLMGVPVATPTLLVPVDAPVQQAVRLTLQDQVAAAMHNRAELAQQVLRIDSATTVTRAARNNLLPQLNLVGNVGLAGPGDDWSSATSNQGDMDFVNWALGIQFEVPIGNRGPNAIWQRTLLQRQQAVVQLRSLSEQIALEVARAMLEVETSWNELVAARHAVEATREARDLLEVRREIEGYGPTAVQLRLDRQQAYAESQRQEIAARVAYSVALSALERAKGTLLRYNNIVLAEAKAIATTRPVAE